MSAIHIGSIDNFSIITTATYSAWDSRKAEIQVKTRYGDLELSTNNRAHLNLMIEALKQLADDINNKQLQTDGIMTRVINSNDAAPHVIRDSLF
ncbi:MAG: hypothetical protein QXI12_06465 [Candidatus Methanomethyliaceae archaeon]